MNIDRAAKELQETYYNLGLLKLKDKSDDELRQIINVNIELVKALPLTASAQDISDANKRLGENKACIEILEKREKKREREEERQENIWQAKRIWRDNLPSRRREAILNLPIATTYNAQLVAAILESEDCKTEEEIFTLLQEFAEISKEELSALLKSLVTEKILYLSFEGKYYLLNICTADLFPADPLDWATRVLLLKKHSITEEEKEIIIALTEADEPMTFSEIKEKCKKVNSYSGLNLLTEKGVLSSEELSSDLIYFYYFPMLGEKKGGKK